MLPNDRPVGPNPSSAQRCLGIDALRIPAMLGIVLIHLYSQGGVSAELNGVRTVNGVVSFPLFSFAFACVNIYAMISGFVLIRTGIRFSRLLSLWIQVVFTGLAVCLAASLLFGQRLRPLQWIKAVLPISTKEYWFFSCYAGIYCLLPILNRGLRSLGPRSLRALLAGLFGIVVLGGALGRILGFDAFSAVNGYSAFWLLTMYVLGAGLRLTGILDRCPARRLWLTALVCMVLCLAWALVTDRTGLPKLLERGGVLKAANSRRLILDFQNPLLVVLGLCLLGLFARLRPGRLLSAVIRFLSPLTFGVYLIHVNECVFLAATGAFRWIGRLRPLLVLPALLGTALAVFLACAMLDWLRLLLFRLLRVRSLCDKLENRLRALLLRPEKE